MFLLQFTASRSDRSVPELTFYVKCIVLHTSTMMSNTRYPKRTINHYDKYRSSILSDRKTLFGRTTPARTLVLYDVRNTQGMIACLYLTVDATYYRRDGVPSFNSNCSLDKGRLWKLY